MSKQFKENRRRFTKEMDDNSLFIAFAGKAGQSTGDQFYPFTPKRNFYYLTGVDSPGVMLVIHKDTQGTVKETLYLERFDPVAAKWNGAPLAREAAEALSDIENYRLIEDFETDIARFLFSVDKIKVCMDMETRGFNMPTSSEVKFAGKIKKSYPFIEIVNVHGILAKLRSIKSKAEVKNIEKAIEITKGGLYLMFKNSKPGMAEYEYVAYFDYHLRKCGVTEHAFNTIAASGVNATILHYSDNNTKTNDGDLILFDLGAAYNHYSADITRTIPVNGKFTERQKELYNIVLDANLKVVSKIKPGLPMKELNEIVVDHYAKELKRIGLIKDRAEVSKYYYHGVSHPLGLDTHDASRGRDSELKKGMVITVEPGLYIEEEKIGIRIEDDVLVTDDGCEVLSQDIIRTVEDIEALMAQSGRRQNGRLQ